MHENDLQGLDLNLLVALEVLLEEESVGRAARRLGRSPSATSHILARLRDTVGDPLLVRDGTKLVPTPRAQAMQLPLRAALEQIRGVLKPIAAFDPSSSVRQFTLAVHDLILPALGAVVADIVRTAPGIRLQILGHADGAVPWHGVDLVTFGHAGAPTSWRTTSFRNSGWSTIARRAHPWLDEPSFEGWIRLPHLQVRDPVGGPGPVERLLSARDLERRVPVIVPHFTAGMQLVASSDLLLTIPIDPSMLALGDFGLCAVPAPIELPPPRTGFAWPARLDVDPPHRWLRARLTAGLERFVDE